MNIVLTGSLGNIGKPLTEQLVQKGHTVSVISSNPERQKDIETLGVKAAIGTMTDVAFLTATFNGADAVYLMEAIDGRSFLNPATDPIKIYSKIAESYKQAVEASGVKKVIHLSSVGAHTTEGNGVLAMHYHAEQILNRLPEAVAIAFLRPVGFFSNFYRSMQTIKTQGIIISNYGGDAKEPWVSPIDIAAAAAEEMEARFTGRKIRYIASEDVSPNEIAQALGAAIGKPELKWHVISNDELLNRMLAGGMNPTIAKGFVKMQAAQGTGAIYDDYNQHKPTLGQVKLNDFAQEFAKAYNS